MTQPRLPVDDLCRPRDLALRASEERCRFLDRLGEATRALTDASLRACSASTSA